MLIVYFYIKMPPYKDPNKKNFLVHACLSFSALPVQRPNVCFITVADFVVFQLNSKTGSVIHVSSQHMALFTSLFSIMVFMVLHKDIHTSFIIAYICGCISYSINRTGMLIIGRHTA
jgi:hypothetical protein